MAVKDIRRNKLIKSNYGVLKPVDLLVWSLVEDVNSGTPCEKLVARAVLAKEPSRDRTIYPVFDHRFSEDENGS